MVTMVGRAGSGIAKPSLEVVNAQLSPKARRRPGQRWCLRIHKIRNPNRRNNNICIRAYKVVVKVGRLERRRIGPHHVLRTPNNNPELDKGHRA
jgi:hypothetical protein